MQTACFITGLLGRRLNTDLAKGPFDRFRSLPIWQPAPLVGALLGDTVTLRARGGGGHRARADHWASGRGRVLCRRAAAVALIVVFAFSLSWVWTASACCARRRLGDDISFLLLFPLTLLSNIFVDPATLPGWLHAFVT